MHIMTKKFLRSTTISRFTQSWSLLYIVVYVHLDVFIRRLFRDQMWKIYVLVGSARPERSIPQSRKYILKKAIATRQEKFYSKGDRNRKNGKDAQKAHFGNKTIQDDDDISGTLCCCYYNRSHMWHSCVLCCLNSTLFVASFSVCLCSSTLSLPLISKLSLMKVQMIYFSGWFWKINFELKKKREIRMMRTNNINLSETNWVNKRNLVWWW